MTRKTVLREAVFIQGNTADDLAKAILGALAIAERAGMDCDHAIQVALKVMVDYGVIHYGAEYVTRIVRSVPVLAEHKM